MSRMIGAREISEYAQKYNMPVGKDTPLSMEWCFDMADKAYEQGRADAFNEILNEMRKSPFASDKTTFVKKYIDEQLKEQK